MAGQQIFTNQTVNGDSAIFSGDGPFILKISGTFGTGSIDLQCSTNEAGDTFTTTGDVAITSPDAWNLKSIQGVSYKLVLSGVSAPTNIDAFISR
tara:strand:- start:1468 stop:1752 length:285 start_codon:yes stop_codon:yes gene_type:complete